jgi:hypothetical protein
MICRASGFFRGACNKLWESGKSNTITLEEVKPYIFSIFLTWLELGDIENAPTLTEVLALNIDKSVSDAGYIARLLKSYILGDFLLAEKFQNSVMDLLITRCNLYVQSHAKCAGIDAISISYVISNTLPDSLLRRMLYDYWAVLRGRGNAMRDDIPKEFYHQLSIYVIVEYEQGRILKAPWNQDRCVYHSHCRQLEQYSCTKKK